MGPAGCIGVSEFGGFGVGGSGMDGFSANFAKKTSFLLQKRTFSPRNGRFAGRDGAIQPAGIRHATGSKPEGNCHAVGGKLVVSCSLLVVSCRSFGRDIPPFRHAKVISFHPNRPQLQDLPPTTPRVADGWLMAGVVRLLAHDPQPSAAERRPFVSSVHALGGRTHRIHAGLVWWRRARAFIRICW